MATREEYRKKMDAYELEGRASVEMKGLRNVNGYLTEHEPWYKKGVDFAEER